MEKEKSSRFKRAFAKAIIASTSAGVNTTLAIVNNKPKTNKSFFAKNLYYGKDKTLNALNIFFPLKSFRPINFSEIKKIEFQNFVKKVKAIKNQKVKTIFFFHGGAFCGGDKNYFNYFCSKLSDNGFVVVNINYRLIPDVLIDVCYDDCEKAVNFCLKNYKFIDKQKVVFCGDSAGASIASILAARHQDEQIFNSCEIVALGLYYGVYDYSLTKGLFRAVLDSVLLYQYADENFEELSKKHSPITYIKKGFPSCFITSGEIDKLNTQSEALIEKLDELNVPHVDLIFKNRLDGIHGFLNYNRLKSSKESLNAFLKFLDKI